LLSAIDVLRKVVALRWGVCGVAVSSVPGGAVGGACQVGAAYAGVRFP
jgi:hypothetical protein